MTDGEVNKRELLIHLIGAVAVFIVLCTLAACSTIEMGAKYVADSYCEKPLEERYLIRYNVNHYVHPHKVEVTCSKMKPHERVPAELEVIER